jgi:hypothetical protein
MKRTIIKPLFYSRFFCLKYYAGKLNAKRQEFVNTSFKALPRKWKITMPICLPSRTATSTYANDEIQILGASHQDATTAQCSTSMFLKLESANGVSGVQRDENVKLQKSSVGGPKFLCTK